jgi:hypothetical protein
MLHLYMYIIQEQTWVYACKDACTCTCMYMYLSHTIHSIVLTMVSLSFLTKEPHQEDLLFFHLQCRRNIHQVVKWILPISSDCGLPGCKLFLKLTLGSGILRGWEWTVLKQNSLVIHAIDSRVSLHARYRCTAARVGAVSHLARLRVAEGLSVSAAWRNGRL